MDTEVIRTDEIITLDEVSKIQREIDIDLSKFWLKLVFINKSVALCTHLMATPRSWSARTLSSLYAGMCLLRTSVRISSSVRLLAPSCQKEMNI